MSDVFLSYSRRNRDFAKRLIERLLHTGKDAWVDWEGIPLTAPNWWAEIKAGIDGADSFVFIISPDSLASMVCNMELDYAAQLLKRIVPVVYQEIESHEAFASIADFKPDEAMAERLEGKDPLVIARDNWQRLSHINWIFFREADDFDTAFDQLVETIETDLEYVKAHTRYLTRAQEWQRENRRSDLLLFGSEIDRAEAWLKDAGRYAAQATTRATDQTLKIVNPLADRLQQDYITTSRQADRQRRRLARSAQVSIAVLIAGVVIGLLIVAQTRQEVVSVQGTSTQSVANANTQVADAQLREATAIIQVANAQRELTAVPPTLTLVNQQVDLAQEESNLARTQAANADRTLVALQPTLTEVNAQIAIAIATVTQAAIVQDIVGSLAHVMVEFRDDPARQIREMNAVVTRYPQQTSAYQWRGLAYYGQGDYDRAIADFTQAITLDPSDAATYINRGIAYFDQGDYDRAIADYSQAITLDPTDATAYNNRGNAYYDQDDTYNAIADYSQAITLDPTDATAYNNRGLAYRSQGDYDRAIADFTQAITLDATDATTYTNRGIAYGAQNDTDNAIADYSQAITLDPTNVTAYTNRGIVYGLQSDYDRAIADFTQAITLDPAAAAAYNGRGIAYLVQGSYDSAIADFDAGIRLGDLNAYLWRGNAFYFAEKYQSALDDWTQYEALVEPLPTELEALRQDALEQVNEE